MNSDSSAPSIVAIPSDLENEPFACDDTGVRSEINHINRPRAMFYCRIYESHGDISIVCNMDDSERSLLSGMSTFYRSRQSTARWKMSTQISVHDVYDNYGLSVTLAYIDRLLSSDIARHQPDWAAAYLVVSLEAADSSLASESSQLWTGLRMQSIETSEAIERARVGLIAYMTRDSQSRLSLRLELVPIHVELPIELLVTIINSTRVSKEIAKHVTQARLIRELLPGEMHCYASRPHTEKLGPGFSPYQIHNQIVERHRFCLVHDRMMWLLLAGHDETLSRDVFQLEHRSIPNVWGIGVDCVFSPRDVALTRGVSTRSALDHCLDREDIDVVCGWIVQLSYELSSTVELTMNKSELLLYYDTLVRRARNLWR